MADNVNWQEKINKDKFFNKPIEYTDISKGDTVIDRFTGKTGKVKSVGYDGCTVAVDFGDNNIKKFSKESLFKLEKSQIKKYTTNPDGQYDNMTYKKSLVTKGYSDQVKATDDKKDGFSDPFMDNIKKELPNNTKSKKAENMDSTKTAEFDSSLPSWVPEIDLSDVAFGAYWWASDNHSGQTSPGYEALSILSRIVTPGRNSSGPEPDSAEAFVYEMINSEDEALSIAKYVEDNSSAYLAKINGETATNSYDEASSIKEDPKFDSFASIGSIESLVKTASEEYVVKESFGWNRNFSAFNDTITIEAGAPVELNSNGEFYVKPEYFANDDILKHDADTHGCIVDPNNVEKVGQSDTSSESDSEEMELLVNDGNGIYIPKYFIENYSAEEWHIDPETAAILANGPDDENYLEAWDQAMNMAYVEKNGKKYTLYQGESGDLFAVPEGFDSWEDSFASSSSIDDLVKKADDMSSEEEYKEDYLVSIVYQVVTPESAQRVEYADEGYEQQDVPCSKEEVVNCIFDGGFVMNSSPLSDNGFPHGSGERIWLSNPDAEVNMYDGSETTRMMIINRADGQKISFSELGIAIQGHTVIRI